MIHYIIYAHRNQAGENYIVEKGETQMNKLLHKIYGTVICNEKDAIEIRREVDSEILELLHEHEEAFEKKELEQVRELMFETAFIAQSAGFELGVHYLFKLLLRS